jgi:CTP synthase
MHSPSAKRAKTKGGMLSPNSERQAATNIVLVTGGVMSGIGKGITASSIGVILKDCGWRTTAIKIDPYLNFDSGTMSPFEHGECYVLDDGGETDLDLGNYERFLDINLKSHSSMTTGKVYKEVIDKERRGDYLGKTVQVVPHVTNAIQEGILNVSKISVDGEEGAPDFCVIELGGTVGDIESAPFVEALRQLSLKKNVNMCHVHVSLCPMTGGEQKTKPTQHGVQTLRSLGLSPDIICCRCEEELKMATKTKLALFCNTR